MTTDNTVRYFSSLPNINLGMEFSFENLTDTSHQIITHIKSSIGDCNNNIEETKAITKGFAVTSVLLGLAGGVLLVASINSLALALLASSALLFLGLLAGVGAICLWNKKLTYMGYCLGKMEDLERDSREVAFKNFYKGNQTQPLQSWIRTSSEFSLEPKCPIARTALEDGKVS